MGKFDISVMGDFNINVKTRMKALGFNQLIKDPTRIDLRNES